MFVLNFLSVAAFDFDSYHNSNCINASYLLTTLLCWVSIPLFLPAHYATAFVADSCQQLLCVCRVHCEMTRHTQDKQDLTFHLCGRDGCHLSVSSHSKCSERLESKGNTNTLCFVETHLLPRCSANGYLCRFLSV